MSLPRALRLRAAVQALGAGGIIACPTEAVWGLSCDPENAHAVTRLLKLKQRSVDKGLILVASDESQLFPLLEGLNDQQRKALSDSWPGPATWLIPHNGAVPVWIAGSHDTVAVRVSEHPAVRALCIAWGGPVVSTSANPGGAQPAKAAFQVRRYFGNALDGMLPGALGSSTRPTVIRDLVSGGVIRQ
ncbi:MAG: L-threonylcarbamoyladenylate synthase [Bacteroidia bacterium]|jgi:L-threonylcarbamoyladenylate synthase